MAFLLLVISSLSLGQEPVEGSSGEPESKRDDGAEGGGEASAGGGFSASVSLVRSRLKFKISRKINLSAGISGRWR